MVDNTRRKGELSEEEKNRQRAVENERRDDNENNPLGVLEEAGETLTDVLRPDDRTEKDLERRRRANDEEQDPS